MNYLKILILLYIVAAFYFLSTYEVYDKVKSGKMVLECFINNEYKVIQPERIVSYDMDTGYWIFDNGYAKNCITYQK